MTNRSLIGHAVNWSAIDVLVRYGLNFIVLIILARILSPADFGLVAMLALFVAVSGVLIDSGFSQSIIQRQQTTLTDESTIFFFTLMMGALIALILCASAPWIAAFYGQPPLEEMAYWMALNLFINTFGTMHTALLAKKLDFKTITKAGVVTTLVSGGVAIFMALQGCGVWSLVAQVLASTITMVIMLWLLHSWRPQWLFSFASLRAFFKFGGFLLWTGLLNTLYTNLYALLIGKLHSVQEVGFYSQAQRLQQLPVNVMTSIVGRVAFPIFAAASEEKAKLARGMRKAIISVMFFNVPLMFGLMILANPLVLALFGPKWLPSVHVLQVLAVVGLMWPLHVLNLDALKAQGYSAHNARLQLIKLTIAILLLLVTSPYGILVIAYGQVVASLLGFFVNTHYTRIFLNYGWYAQLRDIAPYFAASICMGLAIAGAMQAMIFSGLSQLIVAIFIGVLTYVVICWGAKLEALSYLHTIVRRSN